jgi:hypothetical protein
VGNRETISSAAHSQHIHFSQSSTALSVPFSIPLVKPVVKAASADGKGKGDDSTAAAAGGLE